MKTATHYFYQITMPDSVCKFSAWFAGDPLAVGSMAVLVDAERIDSRGRSYRPTPGQIRTLERGGWSARQWGTFPGGVA